MSKIYGIPGEGGGALCVVYSHFYLPSEYGIDLNFRHLSSSDNIDMIEMHRTKTFLFVRILGNIAQQLFLAHFAK